MRGTKGISCGWPVANQRQSLQREKMEKEGKGNHNRVSKAK